MKSGIFVTTVNDKSIYSFLIETICRKHKIQNKDLIYIFNFKKNFHFQILIKFIKIFFSKFFFDTNLFAKLEVENCQIGRHVLAQVFSIYKANTNVIYFFLFKIFYLIKGLIIIDYLKKNKDQIRIMYVDHGVYLNGIFFNFFKKKKIFLYSSNFPKGIFCKNLLNSKKNLRFEDFVRIKKDNTQVTVGEKKFLKKSLDKAMLKNIEKRIYLPWMVNKIYKNLNHKDIDKYDYLIYAHAFTDGQLLYGYDGFVTMYDWLCFTIDFLLKRNKKIIIKAHPNFNKYYRHPRSSWEVELFSKVKKKFNHENSALFISDPIKNYEILNLINKKTILITHHGTPVLEGSFSNFKVICSNKTYWSDEYKICNYWSNIDQYKKILKKDYNNLKFGNQNHLYQLGKKLFLSDFNEFSKNYYLKKYAKFYGMSWIKIMVKNKLLPSFNRKDRRHLALVAQLEKCIENI
jgi:hypothetical protein